MPEEKTILTADQYVVKLLGNKENELTKLQERYDELLKKFVKLQVELEKYGTLKSLFICESTSTYGGYAIRLKHDTTSTLIYSWEENPDNQPKPFKELLDLLGLELPELPKTTEQPKEE